MPTIITHSIVGLLAGKIFTYRKMSKRFWVLSAILPLLPDADVIGFRFGVPYGHFFGHRGFFHSPFFAFLLALFVVCFFFRNERVFSKRWWLFLVYFSFITATHGILDAFTNGGLGIALLSPFDSTRYFFPWTPVQVAPIGIISMFSLWGIQVLVSEARWVWLPLSLIALVVMVIRNNSVNEENA